jgi:phage/plasmid-like protein (TIGR03299 family)
MSSHTLEWHNVWSLIGDTEKRKSVKDGWHQHDGSAWHYREALQGDEPNHYPHAIPVADVERRLFNWEAEAVSPMVATIPGKLLDDGTIVDGYEIADEKRQMICRPRGVLGDDDKGAILGTFKAGYKIHSYREWLLRNVEVLLDDKIHVAAAGLLREGAQGWVEVSVPESVKTPEGVEFFPNLLCYTSLDGSWATDYRRTIQMSICDNTIGINRALKDLPSFKVKHSTNSLNKLGEMRERLHLEFDTVADRFSDEVAKLTNITVTDAQWAAFQDAHELTTLVDPKTKNPKEKASRTHAMNRRAEFEQLYRYDDRCKEFTGTAFGVLQTVNTHAHHVGTVRGMSRPMRNMDNAISGATDKLDNQTLDTLNAILTAS